MIPRVFYSFVIRRILSESFYAPLTIRQNVLLDTVSMPPYAKTMTSDTTLGVIS